MAKKVGGDSKSQMSYRFKVAVVGMSGVGKSSLVERFKTGRFLGEGQTASTIGGAFVTLDRRTVHGDQVGVWDTGGQRRFSHMLPQFLRGTDVVLLCFKMGDQASVEGLHRIYQDHVVHCGCQRFIVVATQKDAGVGEWQPAVLRETEQVGRDWLALFGDQSQVFMVSSKTSEGCPEVVERIYDLLERDRRPQKDPHIIRLAGSEDEEDGHVKTMPTGGCRC